MAAVITRRERLANHAGYLVLYGCVFWIVRYFINPGFWGLLRPVQRLRPLLVWCIRNIFANKRAGGITVESYIRENIKQPKPFRWTATAGSIVRKINKYKETSDTPH